MCTHRGCPWTRGCQRWLATSRGQWVRVSPGGGSHPSLGLPPPLLLPSYLLPPPSQSSTHCLICHCQVCLHRAARVKLALWKWERMFAQLTEPFEVRLKEHSSPHLEPSLSLNMICMAVFFDRLWYLSTFSTNSHSFVFNLTPGCCIACLKMAEPLWCLTHYKVTGRIWKSVWSPYVFCSDNCGEKYWCAILL